MYMEGAAIWTGGGGTGLNVSPALPFLGTGTPGTFTPNAGWEAAIGADYKFAGSPWHASRRYPLFATGIRIKALLAP